jgi:hypothetical protein
MRRAEDARGARRPLSVAYEQQSLALIEDKSGSTKAENWAAPGPTVEEDERPG